MTLVVAKFGLVAVIVAMFIHLHLSLVINVIMILLTNSYYLMPNQLKYNNLHVKLLSTNSYNHCVRYRTSLYDSSNSINVNESQQSTLNVSNINIFQSIGKQFKIIWDFTRPHTIVGSMLSIICLYLYAIPPMYWKQRSFILSLLKSLAPSLLMNLYITG